MNSFNQLNNKKNILFMENDIKGFFRIIQRNKFIISAFYILSLVLSLQISNKIIKSNKTAFGEIYIYYKIKDSRKRQKN